MIDHARLEMPNECCGVLLGREGVIQRCLPMQSVPACPDSYFMDPVQQVTVFEEMEARGESLLGIYHSHPRGPLHPSGADLQLAFHPDSVYFIVSLEDPQAPVIGAYRLDRDAFKRIDLEVI